MQRLVSTYLMGGDSAHSDQDGSLWLNPVLMHSSCSLDLSSFKPRGYPCHGVMGCSTSPVASPGSNCKSEIVFVALSSCHIVRDDGSHFCVQWVQA
jgi:hypothetical protein